LDTETLSLTEKLEVNNGSHILYFYNSEQQYIENAVSFILSAKSLNQKVFFIESEYFCLEVYNRLAAHFSDDEEMNQTVQYINNYEFYQAYGDFKFERVLGNLKEMVQPYVDGKISFKLWGHVDWKHGQANIKEKLHCYESEADLTLSEIGHMTVCCYNGNDVPANVMTQLLKSHEYFMTDTELVRSNLYKQTTDVVFPSLTLQNELESELDFYKRKLDFIHVVSHEVRNPLTVIQAFAAILKSELEDDKYIQKLQLIEDYAVAIDHEINHIIQTEQMLTTDTLWKRKLMKPVPVIKEVLDVMRLKGRTQNVSVTNEIDINSTIIINGNKMGIKLILSNLLSNAIKYSNEGQTVNFKVYKQRNTLVLEVSDQGVGMSNEQLNELFMKYGKMNQDKPGQGIGLFMVHKIVEHFNGTISVESELGKGSTFKVCFPI
jgi:two-component sensor histidine kinase